MMYRVRQFAPYESDLTTPLGSLCTQVYRLLMISSFRIGLALAIGAGAMCTSNLAEASCGLDYCPLPSTKVTNPTSDTAVRLRFQVRHTNFSLDAGEGSYQESIFRSEINFAKVWRLGAWVTPIHLSARGEEEMGIANPVFFGERSFPINTKLRLITGLQIELPLGTSGTGIASAHSELLPYLGASYDAGGVVLQLNGGAAIAVGESHSHDANDDHGVLFVNPHEDKETLVRMAVQAPRVTSNLRLGAQLNSRMPVEDFSKATLVAAFSGFYELSDDLSLSAELALPLVDERRFDWRTGIGINWGL